MEEKQKCNTIKLKVSIFKKKSKMNTIRTLKRNEFFFRWKNLNYFNIPFAQCYNLYKTNYCSFRNSLLKFKVSRLCKFADNGQYKMFSDHTAMNIWFNGSTQYNPPKLMVNKYWWHHIITIFKPCWLLF